MKGDLVAVIGLLFLALTSVWSSSDGPPTIDARLRAIHALSGDSPATAAAWDPYEFGGRPRIAEPQTFLYPPALVHRSLGGGGSFSGGGLWHISDARLTRVSYVLHVWFAGLAIFAGARRLRAGPAAACAFALAFMTATLLGYPAARVSAEIVFRFAWLPLLAAAILASAGRPSSWRAHAAVVATGVVIALAGSPRTQAYGLIIMLAGYALVVAWAPSQRGRLAIDGLVATALIILISAPGSFPTLRLWRSLYRSGGLMSSEPFNGSWQSDGGEGVGMSPELAGALRALRPARVISACPEVVDAIDLRALGVRSVGGYGGVYAADYARFVNLIGNQTRTASLPYVGLPKGGEVRPDLLQFLDAEYLVSCEPARGEFVRSVDEVRIYRTRQSGGAAIWTCYPNRVGRKEIEHRLATRRYDRTLSLRAPGPKINVRWAPDVDDAAREAIEARFHLAREGQPDGRTRRYELLDPSRANVEALLMNPAVEDTAGLNRATLEFDKVPEVRFDEKPTEWLVGLEPCPEMRPASLVRQSESGEIVVDVDAPAEGVVLFSETFYRSRTATVDDRSVPVLEVNLAFAAVPVPQGRHRVGLGVEPDTRRMDSVVSMLALLGWAASWAPWKRPLRLSASRRVR
jgi:hypothetical protein